MRKLGPVAKILLGFLLLCVGCGSLGATANTYLGWQGNLTAETISVEVHPAFSGTTHWIEVGGQRYRCTAGTKDVNLAPALVLYDPADPSLCREKSSAQGLGSTEFFGLLFGAWWFLCALLLIPWGLWGLTFSSRRDPTTER